MTQTATRTTTVIDLEPAEEYRTRHYGVVLMSTTAHMVTGPDVHNRAFRHLVEVWENRPGRARDADPDVIIDPHGKPTSHRYSYLLSAQPSVIAAYPIDREPDGPALAVGERIELRVSGYVIGAFIVTAGILRDPSLIPAPC